MNRDRRKARFTLGTLVVISLLAITLDLRGGSTFDAPRSVASDLFSPLQRLVTNVTSPIGRFITDLTKINSNREVIAKLKKDVATLREKAIADQGNQSSSLQLAQTLNLAGNAGYRVVPAKVISLSQAGGFSHTMGIDVGSRDGVTIDMTVISAGGLVGRVIHVSSSYSTVLMINDDTFKVGARLAGTQALGIVSGTGGYSLQLELLDAQTEVRIGDQLVTRGSEGGKPFVPGVPLGRVVKVEQTPGALTRTAEVKPYVNLSTLDTVAVVLKSADRDPRDSLVPKPIPTPTVTVTVTATPSPTTTSDAKVKS